MIWQKMENSLYYYFQILLLIFDFNFYGLVAQMVDRRLGMAEAPGSNPGQSTLKINFIVIEICY